MDTPEKLSDLTLTGLLLTHAKSTGVLSVPQGNTCEAGVQEGRLFLSCGSTRKTRPLAGDVAGGEDSQGDSWHIYSKCIGQNLSHDIHTHPALRPRHCRG